MAYKNFGLDSVWPTTFSSRNATWCVRSRAVQCTLGVRMIIRCRTRNASIKQKLPSRSRFTYKWVSRNSWKQHHQDNGCHLVKHNIRYENLYLSLLQYKTCVLKYTGPHYTGSAEASIPFLKVAMPLAYKSVEQEAAIWDRWPVAWLIFICRYYWEKKDYQPFKRWIKSHLPFAGIIKGSFSPR